VAKVTLCGFRRAVPYKKKTSRNSAQETQGIKGMSRHSAAHYFLEGLVDLGVEYAERGAAAENKSSADQEPRQSITAL
jgi:hypothetical protein